MDFKLSSGTSNNIFHLYPEYFQTRQREDQIGIFIHISKLYFSNSATDIKFMPTAVCTRLPLNLLLVTSQ